MAKGGVAVLALVMVPVVSIGLILWVLFFGGAAVAACAPGFVGRIDAATIPEDARVGEFGRDQLVNAALIANAASSLELPPAAQTLGVQAAIGESSLTNLDHGDGAINPDGSVADSVGLFQQQSSWGTLDQRMDPTTTATLFFTRLQEDEDWESKLPTVAINTVQGNADPFYYAKFRPDAVAIMAYLATMGVDGATDDASVRATSAAAGCAAVSADAQVLAVDLVTAMEAGRLTFLEDRYAQQVRDMATASPKENCGIDVRILQVITIAVNNFQSVGVSDINRRCTGSLLGAGTGSAHWIDGGGHAVDFMSLDRTPITGCDSSSVRLLEILDPIVPLGSRAGQVQCRTETFDNITQFEDEPNHLHFDVYFADGGLTTG